MNRPTFQVKEEKKENGYTQFFIEPLEPGFGHTIGVALRRVLLTNIEGAAVTSVKIDGVQHMFTTLPGLKEDIIELIFNIKTLRVRLPEGVSSAKLILSKTGPGDITGADVEGKDGAEIVDPKHYLGNLSDKKSKITMEMTVEKGFGYSLANEREVTTVGVIPVDAIFTPVTKVNYKVEPTRVGGQTNYDKLILEVSTDGSVDPKDAVETASSILVSYFKQVFSPEEGVEDVSDVASVSREKQIGEDVTVDELDLPTRIYNSLKNAGMETVADILNTPRKELMAYRNLGAKSLSIIEEALDKKGIEFNSK